MPTNNTVYVDSTVSDRTRRDRLFAGQIFLFTPTPQTRALRDFAAQMVEDAFAPHDPLTAQFDLPVEAFVQTFGPLKPKFIHHPETKRLMREALLAFGCDLEETYLDVPRLRGVTSDAYLTAGVGYAHPMHRDTWWSAPLAQLNWWMPIHELESESSMAFHPEFWEQGVENHSEDFNYYEWNAIGRADAAKHIHEDTRVQPHPPADLPRDPQVRFVVPPGGVVLFSGAQLHSTVPNTSGRSRFSIDFRTVNIRDLEQRRSAPNVDSQPQGTSLRDFRRMSDDAAMPDDVVASYDSGEVPDGAVLVFSPDGDGVSVP
jgi:Phytanoyl-CoA dioxygenase (PhyH)